MSETKPEPTMTPTPATHRILRGHTTPETAFMQPDYPCGFTSRTQRRVWAETATKGAGKGQTRVMTQTRHKNGVAWNAPKGGVYHTFVFLFARTIPGQETYVDFVPLTRGTEIASFFQTWSEHLTSDERDALSKALERHKIIDQVVSRMMGGA